MTNLGMVTGRYSLSVMRLLVPTRSPDALPIGDDQQAVTVSVSIDIAGVPTPPFTASLLSGKTVPDQSKSNEAFVCHAQPCPTNLRVC